MKLLHDLARFNLEDPEAPTLACLTELQKQRLLTIRHEDLHVLLRRRLYLDRHDTSETILVQQRGGGAAR